MRELTVSDSRAIQGYLYFLFIYCITLFEILPEIAFGVRLQIVLVSIIIIKKQKEKPAKRFPK